MAGASILGLILVTFLLLSLLDIENDLLLRVFAFIGSFIPVLGVLLSGIPIASRTKGVTAQKGSGLFFRHGPKGAL